MKTLFATALFCLLLFGCESGISGNCNHCPTFQSMSTDACRAFAQKHECKSAEVKEVTDESCALGKPPMTHMSCIYTLCKTSPNCDEFAAR